MTNAARSWLAPLLLALVATLALPGRFLADPLPFDSYSVRVKSEALSLPALFDPTQTAVANPYYRPLYTVLQALSFKVANGAAWGERTLALLCHVVAALALFRLARTLRVDRVACLGALALFLVAPPNVTTVAWPVVAYWTLADALVWFATADLVEFTASGGRGRLVRALVVAFVSLFSSESAYHLVAFLPLLALAPPIPAAEGSRPRRAWLVWPVVALVGLLHFRFCERGASGLVTGNPLQRASNAVGAWPKYLEGVVGGDALTGSRWIAWVALGLALLGVEWRSSRDRLLLLAALAAPIPFAALGHNDRYAYFAHGIVAIAYATFASRTLRRVVASLSPAAASAAVVVPLLAVQLAQLPPRLHALSKAGREYAALRESLAPLVEAGKLADPTRAVFVNCPSTLKWVVWDAAAVDRPVDFQALEFRHVLAARSSYFSLTPLDLGPLHKSIAVVGESGRVFERPLDTPLGDRRREPAVFLAAAVEVVPPPHGTRDRDVFDRMEHMDAVLARLAQLDEPASHVLVEEPVDALGPAGSPLPTERLAWHLEPAPPLPDGSTPAGLFGMQLVADVAVERSALFVAAIALATDDPLHRVAGEASRSSDVVEALLDGAPAAIVPVFVHGVGVVVPKGGHRVLLRGHAGNSFVAPSGR
jgi:hypothetical protein